MSVAWLSACKSKDEAALREALDQGADPNGPSDAATTPLHMCAHVGFHEGLRLLIQAGANVEALNFHGVTPLIKAAQRLDERALGLLIGAGANREARDPNGDRALDIVKALKSAETAQRHEDAKRCERLLEAFDLSEELAREIGPGATGAKGQRPRV